MEGPRYYYKSGKVFLCRVPGDQLRGVGRPEQGQHHGHPARQLECHGQSLEPLEPLELTPLIAALRALRQVPHVLSHRARGRLLVSILQENQKERN